MSKQKISLVCDRLNRNTNEECQNCILNLLRSYLRQIDENTPAFDQEQQILTRLKQVFEQLGAIIVTPEGQIQFVTKRGKELLSQYFSEYISQSLPENLQHWLKYQISSLSSPSQVCFCGVPLHIEQEKQELIVHLIGNLVKDQYLLLLEEQTRQFFSISSLELIGLTKREAEVLFWVAQDKSNAAIAKILDCSKGTVRKHLEHIHQKLGVQSRTAAVIVALEKLGFVNSSFVTTSS